MQDLEAVKTKVKKMQKVVFRILCDIDDFCRENNILYFLSGGSCLGAVRHQGFIPWDDDGDLMMPRKDYERFLALFPDAFPEKYGVGAFSTNPKWQRQYARVWDKKTIWRSENLDDMEIGVFVDLFPIDGLPEGKLARKAYYAEVKTLSALGHASVKKEFLEKEGYRAVKRAAALVTRPFGMRFFTTKMEALAKRYDFDQSAWVGASMAAHYGERETIAREAMSSEVRLPFEGRMLPVPAGYEQYLTNLYGDYMTIPKDAEENGYSHLDHWTVEFPEDEDGQTEETKDTAFADAAQKTAEQTNAENSGSSPDTAGNNPENVEETPAESTAAADLEENKEKVRRIQKVVFAILCDIDDFCRKNNIRYYLSGGSCLGAVRHQGFIPWDDDADLMMPRPDYERFVKLFSGAYRGKYGVGALSIDSSWQLQYARVWDKNTVWKSRNFSFAEMGIFIDIFPIDGLPASARGQKAFYTKLKVLCELGKEASRTEFRKENHYLALRRMAGAVVKPLGTRYFSKKINQIAMKYDFDSSEYVACSMPVHYGARETIRRECMSEAVELPFEGRMLPVPVGYEQYLTNLYGDYMTIPRDAEANGYSHLEHWIVEFEKNE